MSEYRLFSLDGDGRIMSAEWIDAGNDHEALFIARAHGRSAACEVWDDNRLVGRVADHSNRGPWSQAITGAARASSSPFS
jgi:hypothetical protein